MEAKLVIVSGKTNKRDVRLKLPTVIGRSREADLTVAHPMISRRHCELFEADGWVKIKDLGSLNGTYVHGKRIDQEVLLRPNEEFTIGPITFRIEYEAPQRAGEPPPLPAEETPEYIPSFVQPAPDAEAAMPHLTEPPVAEPAAAASAAAVPPSSEQPAPWEDLEALEKEFDFDLAEDLPTQSPPETQQGSAVSEEPPVEQIAEEVLADQLPEAEELGPPSPSETVQPDALAEAARPEAAKPKEALPAQRPPASAPAGKTLPKTKPQPGKEPSAAPKHSASQAPGPAGQPPGVAQQSAGSAKKESDVDDLDEIEDAALRDFLKGLR